MTVASAVLPDWSLCAGHGRRLPGARRLGGGPWCDVLGGVEEVLGIGVSLLVITRSPSQPPVKALWCGTVI